MANAGLAVATGPSGRASSASIAAFCAIGRDPEDEDVAPDEDDGAVAQPDRRLDRLAVDDRAVGAGEIRQLVEPRPPAPG